MKLKSMALLVLFVTPALAGCGTSGTSRGSSSPTNNKFSQADLVSKVVKSTVRLVGQQGRNGIVAGTGVVVDVQKGFVLTNAHVVAGISSLKITFNDGSDSPGQVQAKNPCDDLAVVRIVNRPDKLQALAFGDSMSMRAGEHVTAIGYPASLQEGAKPQPSATEGSISTTDISAEPDPSLPKYPSLIQHQAPINPGNSGGPLVNDKAQLIGINTLGNTIQGGRIIQGQSYAISSRKIKTALADLESGKSSNDVGWRILPTDDDVIQAVRSTGGTISRQSSQQGMFVVSVDSGSPADEAKIGSGAEIITVEGTQVRTFQQVCDIVESHGPGQSLSVTGYDAYSNRNPIPIATVNVKLR